MKIFLTAIAFVICVSANALAATDFYDSGSRTISVAFEQPVDSVAVHITGNRPGFGCVKPKTLVYTMNFVPGSQIKTNSALSAKLAAVYKGVKGQIAASSQKSATTTTPAVFSYNFTGVLTSLHYNIVYTRNGKRYALGWRPDSGGGCTYAP